MRRIQSSFLVLNLLIWMLVFLSQAQATDDPLEKRVEQLEKELKEVKDSKKEEKPGQFNVQTAFGIPITFGGFVDTYYAFDFKEPPTMNRVFTTQPSRHNEFNVNLAYLEAKVNEEKYRGRLAFQAGTSVDVNYAAEASVLSRHIQEAYVGYSPFKDLWIDAGIYFSHLGNDSFISRDNWNYSRSLSGDFSPYYQTGIRISYQWAKEFSTQFHVMNGWQNIAENNAAKAIGMQFAFQPNDHLSLTYNNFIGKEVRDNMRYFHDFIAKVTFEPVAFAFIYDLGSQGKDFQSGMFLWHVFTLEGRYQVLPNVALAGRFERFIDKDQAIVVTHTSRGFQTWGASGNIDIQLTKNVVWRNEYRHFWSADPVYPNKSNGSKQDHFAVTSLALSF